MYLIIKQSHLTLVLLSVSFLVIRVFAVSMRANWMQKRWTKIAPHMLDTLLLISAIALMTTIKQYPLTDHWLSTKVLGLFGYIIFGARALKGDNSAIERFCFLLLALACISYMALVAITKNPLPFLL